MEKAKKQTDRAEWAQADALDKFKRYQKLHAESESNLAAKKGFAAKGSGVFPAADSFWQLPL